MFVPDTTQVPTEFLKTVPSADYYDDKSSRILRAWRQFAQGPRGLSSGPSNHLAVVNNQH